MDTDSTTTNTANLILKEEYWEGYYNLMHNQVNDSMDADATKSEKELWKEFRLELDNRKAIKERIERLLERRGFPLVENGRLPVVPGFAKNNPNLKRIQLKGSYSRKYSRVRKKRKERIF